MNNSLQFQKQNKKVQPPNPKKVLGNSVFQSISPSRQMENNNQSKKPKSKIILDQSAQQNSLFKQAQSFLKVEAQRKTQNKQLNSGPKYQQSKSYSPSQHYKIQNQQQNQKKTTENTKNAYAYMQNNNTEYVQKKVKIGGGAHNQQHLASSQMVDALGQSQPGNKFGVSGKVVKRSAGVFTNYGGAASNNSGTSGNSNSQEQTRFVTSGTMFQQNTQNTITSNKSSSNNSKGSQLSAKQQFHNMISKGASLFTNKNPQSKSQGSQKSQKSQNSKQSVPSKGSQNKIKFQQNFDDYGVLGGDTSVQDPQMPNQQQFKNAVRNPQFMTQQHPQPMQGSYPEFAGGDMQHQSPARNQQQPYHNYDHLSQEGDHRDQMPTGQSQYRQQSSPGKQEQQNLQMRQKMQQQANQISQMKNHMVSQQSAQIQSRNRSLNNDRNFTNYTVQNNQLQDTQGLFQNFQSPKISQDNKKTQKQNSEEPRPVVDFIGIAASGAGTETVGRCLHQMRVQEGQNDPKTEKENKLRQKKKQLMSDSLNMLTKQRNQYLNQSINNSNNSKERRDNSRQVTQKFQPPGGVNTNLDRRNSQVSHPQNVHSFEQNQYQMAVGQVSQPHQVQGSQFSGDSKQQLAGPFMNESKLLKRGKVNHQVQQSDGVALQLNNALSNQSSSKMQTSGRGKPVVSSSAVGLNPSQKQLKVQNILIQAQRQPQKMAQNYSVDQNLQLHHAHVQSFQTDDDMEDGPGHLEGDARILMQSLSQNEYNDSALAQHNMNAGRQQQNNQLPEQIHMRQNYHAQVNSNFSAEGQATFSSQIYRPGGGPQSTSQNPTSTSQISQMSRHSPSFPESIVLSAKTGTGANLQPIEAAQSSSEASRAVISSVNNIEGSKKFENEKNMKMGGQALLSINPDEDQYAINLPNSSRFQYTNINAMNQQSLKLSQNKISIQKQNIESRNARDTINTYNTIYSNQGGGANASSLDQLPREQSSTGIGGPAFASLPNDNLGGISTIVTNSQKSQKSIKTQQSLNMNRNMATSMALRNSKNTKNNQASSNKPFKKDDTHHLQISSGKKIKQMKISQKFIKKFKKEMTIGQQNDQQDQQDLQQDVRVNKKKLKPHEVSFNEQNDDETEEYGVVQDAEDMSGMEFQQQNPIQGNKVELIDKQKFAEKLEKLQRDIELRNQMQNRREIELSQLQKDLQEQIIEMSQRNSTQQSIIDSSSRELTFQLRELERNQMQIMHDNQQFKQKHGIMLNDRFKLNLKLNSHRDNQGQQNLSSRHNQGNQIRNDINISNLNTDRIPSKQAKRDGDGSQPNMMEDKSYVLNQNLVSNRSAMNSARADAVNQGILNSGLTSGRDSGRNGGNGGQRSHRSQKRGNKNINQKEVRQKQGTSAGTGGASFSRVSSTPRTNHQNSHQDTSGCGVMDHNYGHQHSQMTPVMPSNFSIHPSHPANPSATQAADQPTIPKAIKMRPLNLKQFQQHMGQPGQIQPCQNSSRKNRDFQQRLINFHSQLSSSRQSTNNANAENGGVGAFTATDRDVQTDRKGRLPASSRSSLINSQSLMASSSRGVEDGGLNKGLENVGFQMRQASANANNSNSRKATTGQEEAKGLKQQEELRIAGVFGQGGRNQQNQPERPDGIIKINKNDRATPNASSLLGSNTQNRHDITTKAKNYSDEATNEIDEKIYMTISQADPHPSQQTHIEMSAGKEEMGRNKTESVKKTKAFRTVSNDGEPDLSNNPKVGLQNRIHELPRSPRYKAFSQLNTGEFKQIADKKSDTNVNYNEISRSLEGTHPDRQEAEDSRSSEQVSKSKNNFRPLKKLSKNKLFIQKIGKNSYSLVNQTVDHDARAQFQEEDLNDQDRNRQREGRYHEVKSIDADEDYQMMQQTNPDPLIMKLKHHEAEPTHVQINHQIAQSNQSKNAKSLSSNKLQNENEHLRQPAAAHILGQTSSQFEHQNARTRNARTIQSQVSQTFQGNLTQLSQGHGIQAFQTINSQINNNKPPKALKRRNIPVSNNNGSNNQYQVYVKPTNNHNKTLDVQAGHGSYGAAGAGALQAEADSSSYQNRTYQDEYFNHNSSMAIAGGGGHLPASSTFTLGNGTKRANSTQSDQMKRSKINASQLFDNSLLCCLTQAKPSKKKKAANYNNYNSTINHTAVPIRMEQGANTGQQAPFGAHILKQHNTINVDEVAQSQAKNKKWRIPFMAANSSNGQIAQMTQKRCQSEKNDRSQQMQASSTSLPYVNQNRTNISIEAQNSQKNHSQTRPPNNKTSSINNEYENNNYGANNADHNSSANSIQGNTGSKCMVQ